MGFAPRDSGELLDSEVATAHWQAALVLGWTYLARLQEENGFSKGFAGFIRALEMRLAAGKCGLGDWSDSWKLLWST